MGSVTHLPVSGRLITKEDYAEEHVLDLDAADITEALGFTPAPDPHHHDDRYYTQSEVDALVAAAAGGHAPDLLVPGVINMAAFSTAAVDRFAAYLVTFAGDVEITLNNLAPLGSRIRFKQMHAGGFHFVAGPGMALRSRADSYKGKGLYAVSEAWRISATDWSILGDVGA